MFVRPCATKEPTKIGKPRPVSRSIQDSEIAISSCIESHVNLLIKDFFTSQCTNFFLVRFHDGRCYSGKQTNFWKWVVLIIGLL